MTQEEKQLLLKDLSARLPYGVKGLHRGKVHKLFTIDGREANNACIQVDGYDAWFSVDTFKPYLRTMSSMTKEEKEYIKNRWCYNDWDIDGPSSLWREKIDVEDADGIIDYFNAHHFDYRGLIEKGLAIEAPKDIYKTE